MLPEGTRGEYAWYQTVLTFGQVVAELQGVLLRSYGLAVDFGKAADLAFEAFSSGDVFGGQIYLRISCARLGGNSL